MDYILLYQGPSANVFDGNFKRLLQHSYSACEWFVRGLQAVGGRVQISNLKTGF